MVNSERESSSDPRKVVAGEDVRAAAAGGARIPGGGVHWEEGWRDGGEEARGVGIYRAARLNKHKITVMASEEPPKMATGGWVGGDGEGTWARGGRSGGGGVTSRHRRPTGLKARRGLADLVMDEVVKAITTVEEVLKGDVDSPMLRSPRTRSERREVIQTRGKLKKKAPTREERRGFPKALGNRSSDQWK